MTIDEPNRQRAREALLCLIADQPNKRATIGDEIAPLRDHIQRARETGCSITQIAQTVGPFLGRSYSESTVRKAVSALSKPVKAAKITRKRMPISKFESRTTDPIIATTARVRAQGPISNSASANSSDEASLKFTRDDF